MILRPAIIVTQAQVKHTGLPGSADVAEVVAALDAEYRIVGGHMVVSRLGRANRNQRRQWPRSKRRCHGHPNFQLSELWIGSCFPCSHSTWNDYR